MDTQKHTSKQINRPDDISVRVLYLKSIAYFFFLLRWWWILAISIIMGGLWGYYVSNQLVEVFSAEAVIMVKPQDIAKERKADVLVLSRFASTQSVIEELLLQPIDDETDELVINKYLHTYMEKKPDALLPDLPQSFEFTNTFPETYSAREKLIFKRIVEKITTYVPGHADGFINVSVDEVLGLVTIATATPSEELTTILIDKLIENFKRLVINFSVYAQEKSYEDFRNDVDSLEQNYKALYYDLHTTRDKYQRFLNVLKDSTDGKIIYLKDKIIRLEVEADVYEKNWNATVKIFKSIQNEMNQKTPMVEEIKRTLPPLMAYKPSPARAAIKEAIKWGIGVFLLLIVGKILYDSIQEETEELDAQEDLSN